jgi:hypothetical protein
VIRDADIDRWFQLAMASTPGALLPCYLALEAGGPPVTERTVIVEKFVAAMAADGSTFYGVLQREKDIGDLPGGDCPICWTGAGSLARADADFFAEARTIVLKLVEENRVLTVKLKAMGIDP